ncbi:hypothetical protein J2787_000339 [Chryseobacterium rhizosphaerae]|uniref:Uncharacterized protein n=1 Tax=Chryseobacterium rhizosphaerae TaxID=395937 RepID=A0AAE3Y6Q6_9FLAO|nr:hypothetical protein [Chryseobacterium rhizosphaerae]
MFIILSDLLQKKIIPQNVEIATPPSPSIYFTIFLLDLY